MLMPSYLKPVHLLVSIFKILTNSFIITPRTAKLKNLNEISSSCKSESNAALSAEVVKLTLLASLAQCLMCTHRTQLLLKNENKHTQSRGLKATYILVLHVFEQPQLSVSSLCMDDGLEGPGEFFYRYP